jgi:hypothetical protein
MGYGLEDWGSISIKGEIFLYSRAFTSAMKPIQWVLGLFHPLIEQKGHRSHHSSSSSPVIKYG